jgi:hypothetical protein
MSRNCASLKFASTHKSPSGTTAIRRAPGATRCPTCTERRATVPATGAGISVRCSASHASRTRDAASSTDGCSSSFTLSVNTRLVARFSRAAASDARAAAAAVCAVSISSRDTTPCCASGARRARNSSARCSSASRTRTLASSARLLAYSVRASRTARASPASAWASATSASARSSRTSICPASMRCMSSAPMAITVPATCGVTSTRLPAT